MLRGEITLPVETPLVKRNGQHTTLFSSSKMFAYLFNSRHYVSVYGGALSFYLVNDGAIKELRRKTDKSRPVQIEVYASWLVDGVKYEKLMRELPFKEGEPLANVIRNAAQYLHRSGPLGKRTPPNFRDEDRNWKLYTDENGVERLRLSYEYQRIPGTC